jgi:hypothetical protein
MPHTAIITRPAREFLISHRLLGWFTGSDQRKARIKTANDGEFLSSFGSFAISC